MRALAVAVWLLLCVGAVRGEEPLAVTELPEGGFAPRGAGFRVTFEFAGMKRESKVEWSNGNGVSARLEICSVKCPMGLGEATLAVVRLRVVNASDRPFPANLAVEISPDGAIHALSMERHAFFIEGRPVLVADSPSRGAILADSPFAARPLTPQDRAHVESAKGECRGEMIYDLTLPAGQTQTLGFISPVQLPKGAAPDLDFYRALSVKDLFAQAAKEATRK
jgi:hypothetical protein